MALTNKLSAIGNAIREKTGKTDLLTLDQMPQEIKGIETGGDTEVEDTIIERTITGVYTNNRIETVGENAFRGAKISEFNSTSVKTISSFAFYYVATLEECNTPNVTNFSGNGAFTNCTNLKKVNFKNNSNGLNTNCFNGCTSLEYANIVIAPG